MECNDYMLWAWPWCGGFETLFPNAKASHERRSIHIFQQSCTMCQPSSLGTGLRRSCPHHKNKLHSDVFVEITLVDIDSKCGSINDSHNIFDRMIEQNLVSWTTMIEGYVQHGEAEEAPVF
jgi:hypothetical protein